MQQLCPWCFGAEEVVVWLQQDRPCKRCKYVGNWDGTPVFTHPLHLTLPVEAEIVARNTVEAILFNQDQPRIN